MPLPNAVAGIDVGYSFHPTFSDSHILISD